MSFIVADPRYIVYKIIDGEKIPLSPITGCKVSVKDRRHWMTYDSALQAVTTWEADGVGFIIAEPYWFLDIDHCLVDGDWSDFAVELLAQFRGAAVEVSHSGNGLHIFGRGIAPTHSCKNKKLGIEFYTENRFAALTSTHATGSIEFDATHLLPAFVAKYFPPAPAGVADPVTVENIAVPADDSALLSLMLASKSNPFKQSAAFNDLWRANDEALVKAYPAANDRPDGLAYDASSADAALAQHLAFWTHNDMPRIERLMLSSALVREKWLSRTDYLSRTINKACSRQATFYTPVLISPPEEITDVNYATHVPSLTDGSRLLSIAEQITLFQGCVYILDEHRVLMPGGYVINAERFRVFYGGYSFVMDKENNRISRNAWEAFTENQGFVCPRVMSTCFRPTRLPGEIVEEDGATLVNLWWPIQTPRKQGDATRFLEHLAKLLPDAEERMRVLAYLAALVQYQGVKFEWCLVLQGVEGNGKTLITRCIARAIGNRYTHFPKSDQIGSRFNDWLENRIFIAVEDIDAEGTEHIMEVFKRLVTHERQEIEPKGGRKLTRDVCCNFIINTNHRGALRKSRDDRRLGIFYTAQQEKDDLERDGMTGEYFQSLYNWLKAEGYAIVHDFLATYPIPDMYNPALKHIAPVTKSTQAAIEEGAPIVEQEIQEAIDQGLVGFRGGWVSSIALAQLLERLKVNLHITPKKRFTILRYLGYIPHPALPGGRVNNIVLPDGAKPKLFIHYASPATALKTAADVATAYSDAQAIF